MKRFSLLMNRALHLFEVRKIHTNEQVVYLTFDDGPEPGITEFVLDELRKHNAKATFYCRGDNAEKYPELLKLILKEGHTLGNHTYSHINSFDKSVGDYVEDVERADALLNTRLFRPPWGALTLSSFLHLRKKYKIVYWSLISGDSVVGDADFHSSMKRLESTKKGDVVLFHSCLRHEKATRQLLPKYLNWLDSQGFLMESMS